MGSFVAGLDSTAVNVALPAIRADLGGGLAGQQWVSNAYLLDARLADPGRRLARGHLRRAADLLDRSGRFGAVSVLCAVAPDIGVLIGARALQGAFGALLMPSALAVDHRRVPAGGARRRDRLVDGLVRDRQVIGPLAGGYLVDAVSWRLIFAINVPFVLATLVLVRIGVPARAGQRRTGRWTGSAPG